ncbi:MAG: hypothetical protein IJY38_04700 [Clostridia bacterium]|nr:hypothetical protein [Clostridia bacterium]
MSEQELQELQADTAESTVETPVAETPTEPVETTAEPTVEAAETEPATEEPVTEKTEEGESTTEEPVAEAAEEEKPLSAKDARKLEREKAREARKLARAQEREEQERQRLAAIATAKAKREEEKRRRKKSSPLYEKLIRLFSHKTTQIVFVIAVMLLSAFAMFMLDDYNYVRIQYFPWLENNFFGELFQMMNIKRDLVQGGWLIFLTLFSVILILIAIGALRKKLVDKAVQKNGANFKSLRGAKAFYNFWFYFATVLVMAAIAFVLYMLGVYNPLWMPNVDGQLPPPIGEVCLNLLYIILLCAICILLIVVALFVLSLVLHVVFSLFGWFAAMVNQFRRNMDEEVPVELADTSALAGAGGGGGGGSGDVNGTVDIEEPVNIEIDEPIKIQEEPAPPQVLGKEIVPSIVRLDEQYQERETVQNNADMSLEEFVLQFQAYAISRKIYYELPMLRSFLAGLSAARLIILEGLSGTGKSMLPRMFCEFTHSKSFFAPVQATWRDKSDMLGYFSEFTKSFKSTDFLKNLYEASYTDRVNLMVLDEMNISRIEYYFADFLSILEYPPEDWKVRVFEPVLGQELPEKLDDGYVSIPENTWFIGTANTDDSTFTITDKVYDRAIVLDFAEKFSPITSNYTNEPIHIDYETLKAMFVAAQNDSTKRLSKTDEEKFAKICDFVAESFDLRFGNRIMVQINNFVPVYVALGGSKEEALDFMFARKVLRKLNGAFEDDVKDKLIALLKLLGATYGKGTFKQTEKAIAKILKRLV